MNIPKHLYDAASAGQLKINTLSPFFFIQVQEVARREQHGLKVWKSGGFYGGRRLIRAQEHLTTRKVSVSEHLQEAGRKRAARAARTARRQVMREYHENRLRERKAAHGI